MVIRNLFLTFALAALALPSLAFAQHGHNATVLLRNGDRVSGQLEDVEGGIVYVRVSQDDQRRLQVSNVALIDLVGGATGLPETETAEARGSNSLAVMRDGSSWKGEFVDISGGEATASATESHMLHFRTTSGETQRVSLDKVGRIYFGNFPASTTAAAETAYTSGDPLPAGAIRVPANQQWVATPISVRKGDQVRFNVTGKVQLSSDTGDLAHAAGSLKQRRAAGSPLPQNYAGALIARVGNSAPFPIGDQTAPVTMPADGILYLGVNDDEVSDNKGEFIVTANKVTSR